jgi:RNA polymerase sigma factor (sigma-70 family)
MDEATSDRVDGVDRAVLAAGELVEEALNQSIDFGAGLAAVYAVAGEPDEDSAEAGLRSRPRLTMPPANRDDVAALGGGRSSGRSERRTRPAAFGRDSERTRIKAGGVAVVGAGHGGGDTTVELAIGTRRPRVGSGIDVVELVHRVKNGEVDAFGVLYDRYADLVFRYVLYRVGNRSLAEDIVSDTFLKALRRIGTFAWQGTDIGAWFITIARNLVIDHSRASRARLEFPSDDVLSEIGAGAHAAASVSGPDESVLTPLRDRTLLDAVRALTPDQRECVVLRFLEGLTLRETALAMGRKENAVKALQLRAVRALARHLPPTSDTDCHAEPAADVADVNAVPASGGAETRSRVAHQWRTGR